MDTEPLSRRGFLKLLLLSLALYPGHRFDGLTSARYEPSGSATDLPNILILVFDSFSAEHASFLGYRRNTTPNLSRFADRATVFHQHFAGGNFTVPGTASLLTGAYPWSHRGLHLFGTVEGEYVDRNIFAAFDNDYNISAYTHNPLVMGLFAQFHRYLDQLIPPRALALRSEALADRLFPNDFDTSFWGERIVRGSGFDLPSSLFLSFTNIARNFDTADPQELARKYASLFPWGLPTHSDGIFFLLEDAINWIKDQVASLPQPFLGYYHLLPPHEPYRPRKEFIDLFKDGWNPPPKPILRFSENQSQAELNELRQGYDEYLAYADAEFGRLYDYLDQSGVLQNTWVIFTSDHGQLFERGIHGHVTPTLYDPVVHVPLIICKPGQKEREDVYTPTSCVDLLPTLLQLAGKPVPDWCEGQPLPIISGATPDPDRKIYVVEAKTNSKNGPLKTCTLAMIQGGYKLIAYYGYDSLDPAYELYDLQKDPEERVDLSASMGGVAAELEEELTAILTKKNQQI